VVTKSLFTRNQGTFKVTSLYSEHVVICAEAVVVDDTEVLAKLIYKCQENRPTRVRGPQARLLTISRVGCVPSV
jgi:hypothetical protein